MQGITSHTPSNPKDKSKMLNFTINARKLEVLVDICPKLNTRITNICTNSSNTITNN